MGNLKSKDVDVYIAEFPRSTQLLLEKVRSTIHAAAPKAQEVISYGIPTFQLHGNLVHFAGYKNHIGFYPAASGISAFKKELSVYKGAKGSVQFPLDKEIPLALIAKIVKFRLKENIEKYNSKNTKTGPEGSEGFLGGLSAPARRALENKKIRTLKKLSGYTESQILDLHGIGPSSMPLLRKALKKEGLEFRK